MSKVSIRTSLIAATGMLVMLSHPGSPQANFKYIPGEDAKGALAPAMQAPAGSINAAPLPAPAPMKPMLDPATTGGEVIEGFGNQVPLVTALRQIVPASYQFSYADGIDLGKLVNWKGGRPWRDVLETVAKSQGLVAAEKNSIIYVSRIDAVMGKTQQ